jgi:hypothetical protein
MKVFMELDPGLAQLLTDVCNAGVTGSASQCSRFRNSVPFAGDETASTALACGSSSSSHGCNRGRQAAQQQRRRATAAARASGCLKPEAADRDQPRCHLRRPPEHWRQTWESKARIAGLAAAAASAAGFECRLLY